MLYTRYPIVARAKESCIQEKMSPERETLCKYCEYFIAAAVKQNMLENTLLPRQLVKFLLRE